jgi:hypothetical protein
MKSVWVSAIVIALGLGMAGRAQTPPPAGKVIATAVQRQFATVRKYITQSAEIGTEADYKFKPQGTAADIRTFGAILAHVAGSSFVYCAAAKGVEPPHGEEEFEKNATTRAAIMKAVNDAMTYCDAIYNGYTDAQLSEMGNAAFSPGKAPRINPLLGNISHMNEHYGNLVTYFRAKGIVPPSSRGGGN